MKMRISWRAFLIVGTALSFQLAIAQETAAPAAGKDAPRILVFDKKMRVAGKPLAAAVFKPQGPGTTFSGEDYRNSVLDLSETEVESLDLAQVYSPEFGGIASRSGRHYGIRVVPPKEKDDRKIFVDADWTVFPGKSRSVGSDGPYATVHIKCTNAGAEARGVHLEINGVHAQTDGKGMAVLELSNLRARGYTLEIADPVTRASLDKKLALPVVGARPGVVRYEKIVIDLTKAAAPQESGD